MKRENKNTMNISELETLYSDLSYQMRQMEGLHQVVNELVDGLILINSEGLISICNHTATKLLKLKDATNSSYSTIFSDTFFGFSMSEALLSPEKRHRTFLTLDEEHEIEVTTSWSAQGLTLLLHDRTEVAHLERSSSQSERLSQLGEMAARLAHEIRNPLGGIQGFASLLKDELQDREHQNMASAIINGTKSLNSLVTSVLEYAKPLSLHFAPIDLIETAKEACELSGKKANLKTSLTTWPYSGDKERLKLTFLNLIHNGWEASNTCVQIKITESKISFTDTGAGIKKEHLEKIFTPFFTTKSFGTGLGLPEAKKVIEAHGGEISIHSIEKQGTTIEVSL